MRAVVVIPTYNEKENIERLCRRILELEPRADVLVLDDNSPDGTGEIAERLSRETGRVKALHRPGKLGLGTAHVAGLRYGLEHGYDRVVTMDADFSHPPERIPALLNASEHYDLVLGSRYIPGGGVEGWPWRRTVLSAGANRLARTLLRLSPHDCTGAFRCFRREVLGELELERLSSRGYSIQEEMIWLCQRSGLTIGEVPIVFVDRREGNSKISLKEIAGTMWMLVKLIFAPRPRKVKSGVRSPEARKETQNYPQISQIPQINRKTGKKG